MSDMTEETEETEEKLSIYCLGTSGRESDHNEHPGWTAHLMSFMFSGAIKGEHGYGMDWEDLGDGRKLYYYPFNYRNLEEAIDAGLEIDNRWEFQQDETLPIRIIEETYQGFVSRVREVGKEIQSFLKEVGRFTGDEEIREKIPDLLEKLEGL